MRETALEKGGVYQYSNSCCSAYSPSILCALIIIFPSMTTHARFGREERVKSRPKKGQWNQVLEIWLYKMWVFLKGKCEQRKCVRRQVKLLPHGTTVWDCLSLDDKIEFGGIGPLTPEQRSGWKIHGAICLLGLEVAWGQGSLELLNVLPCQERGALWSCRLSLWWCPVLCDGGEDPALCLQRKTKCLAELKIESDSKLGGKNIPFFFGLHVSHFSWESVLRSLEQCPGVCHVLTTPEPHIWVACPAWPVQHGCSAIHWDKLEGWWGELDSTLNSEA